MFDVETLSNRILDGEFESDLIQNDFSEDDALTHYGVKGMKWGVRKERTSIFTKKRDRRYKDETDKEYQARMNREFQERNAKARAKEQAASEKRAAKERLQLQKMLLKSQEKQQNMQIKSQEKQRAEQAKRQQEEARRREEEAKRAAKEASKKTSKKEFKNVKNMTDQEINDAIARFKLEQSYKQNQKAARSVTDGMLKKTLKGFGSTGGDILLSVGKEIAKQQLKDLGNQQIDKYLIDKGLKEKKDGKNKGMSKGDIMKLIEEALEERDK